VHSKGADSMAVSGLCFENALIGSECATAVLLCTNRLRKQSSCPARRPFPMGKHLSQVKSLQEVTSHEESFMPDISGYIRERVNSLIPTGEAPTSDKAFQCSLEQEKEKAEKQKQQLNGRGKEDFEKG